MSISLLLTFFACTLNLEKLPVHSSFAIVEEHPTMPCLNDSFDLFINVFDIHVAAPMSAPLEEFVHTANVLAEYIDNDADGNTDADDSDCANAYDNIEAESSNANCDDEADNDGDGWVDDVD